jgi:hypothetical protein
MPKFKFDAAMNVRVYGNITVEADSIEAAKAAIAANDFNMDTAFEPHGGGKDDFDYNHGRPDIWLNFVTDEDGNEVELEEHLPVKSEMED